MKYMKKIMAVVMIMAMLMSIAFSMTACSKKKEEKKPEKKETQTEEQAGESKETTSEQSSGSSYDDMKKATGISITAPDGATNVSYSYNNSGDAKMAQVDFTYQGNVFCYRAEPTGKTSFFQEESSGGSEGGAADSDIEDAIRAADQLSGMDCDWESGGGTYLNKNDCMAVFGFNDGAEGYIAWIDTASGTMYSLSVKSGASQELLEDTANLVFVPM